MTREEINQDKQDEIFKEEHEIKHKKNIKRIFKYSILFLFVVFCFLLYTTYFSTIGFIIKEERIINKNLPSEFNGLKVVQFSDLHYGSTIGIDEIKKIVSMINETEADIVVFTGDLIDKDYKLDIKDRDKIIKILSKINVNYGKYAIIGEEDGNDFNTIMSQSDFSILANSYDLIYNNSLNPILITGVSYSKSKNDYENAFMYYNNEDHNQNIYNITLVHQPDSINEFKDKYPSNIYLAGHSHNGNIRIPFIGSIINKSGSKKYYNPYYNIDGVPLYISSGLGTNNRLGIRLFCRPSISLFRFSNK